MDEVIEIHPSSISCYELLQDILKVQAALAAIIGVKISVVTIDG